MIYVLHYNGQSTHYKHINTSNIQKLLVDFFFFTMILFSFDRAGFETLVIYKISYGFNIH